MDISASGFDDKDRELLGRRTFEIFEAYWPYQPDHPIGIGEDFGGFTSSRSCLDILRKIPDEISG